MTNYDLDCVSETCSAGTMAVVGEEKEERKFETCGRDFFTLILTVICCSAAVMTGGAVDLVAVSAQERYADWLKECVTSSAPAEVARVGK